MRKMRSTIKDKVVTLGFFITVLSVVTIVINEKIAIVLLGMSFGTIILGGYLKSLNKDHFFILNRKRAEKRKKDD